MQKQCITLGIGWLAACLNRVDFQFAFTAEHVYAISGLMLFLPSREININKAHLSL